MRFGESEPSLSLSLWQIYRVVFVFEGVFCLLLMLTRTNDGDNGQTRNGHTMTVFQNFILLYCGIHDITHERNDAFLFDTSTMRWIRSEEDSSHNRELLGYENGSPNYQVDP